jgi:DNA-binding NarL/FixJ family response regulator
MASGIRSGPAYQRGQPSLPHSSNASGSSGCMPEALPQRPMQMSIVSGSLLLREGLVSLLTSHLMLELVGSYPTEPVPVAHLPNPHGHVVLLDGNLGSGSTIDWTHYWRELPDPPYVIVIEMPDEVDMILKCIEAGATGYVLRSEPFQSVATTIEAARCGVAYCSPEVTAQLFARLAALRASQEAAAPPPLTAREREVLRLVTSNYSNQQIALALVIEIRTVKHHVHNILEKLKLQHRWEAAQMAAKQRWFEGEREASI